MNVVLSSGTQIVELAEVATAADGRLKHELRVNESVYDSVEFPAEGLSGGMLGPTCGAIWKGTGVHYWRNNVPGLQEKEFPEPVHVIVEVGGEMFAVLEAAVCHFSAVDPAIGSLVTHDEIILSAFMINGELCFEDLRHRRYRVLIQEALTIQPMPLH